MAVIPNADFPQRRPHATVLKRAGWFRIFCWPGWGFGSVIVVDKSGVVGSVGVLRVRGKENILFLQFTSLIEQD